GTSRDAWYVDPWSLGYDRPTNTGGTFNYSVNNGPAKLDPFGPNLQAHPFNDTAYDGLLMRRIGPDGPALASDIICRLCESWERKDQRTYVFKLRQNVKWHDGQPFTAQDVKFSLEKGKDPKTGFEFRSLLETIDRIDVPDPSTVTIVTKAPEADFLRFLGWGIIPMVPQHAYDGGRDLTKTVIGTGPFKLESFDTATSYVGVKNTSFWLPDRPILDRMVGHFIADKSTRQAAFLSKQIDNITVGDANEMKPIQTADPSIKVHNDGGNLVQSLWLNYTKQPFSDKRVRTAIHLALDRDEMNQQLTGGLGVSYMVAGSPSDWQKQSLTKEELAKLPGYRQPKAQDIAEAKRLLAEAGYPNGFKTTSMHVATFTANPEWNEAASGQLRRVGIEVTLEGVEIGVGLKRRTECTYDMYVHVTGAANSMPTRNYSQWVTGGSENWCKYSNPEYDKLVAQIAVEFDDAKRWDLVKKAQTMLLAELPVIPLPERAAFSGWHARLHNWRNYGHSWSFPWYPTDEIVWVDK
ncbi:MAG: ABC transporter substrate-binding protein, partial [Chloroflexi bacterium]|nr:ABC transporter substrate-binding protein [Chloroflexota bacterium]